MNISIYLPVILVQIFLWACVVAACLGLLLLIAAWLSKLLNGMHSYYIAIAIISMRKIKVEDWAEGMFSRLLHGLQKENPKLAKRIGELFRDRSMDTQNEKRLKWLHDYSTGANDPEGYEWGIYRVKWHNGQVVSVVQTNSDFSDLDAEMAREEKKQITCCHCGKEMTFGPAKNLPEGGTSQRIFCGCNPE